MKRRDFLKKAGIIGGGTLAGSLVSPRAVSSLEDRFYGRVIDTLSEEPVENANLKFYDSNGSEIVKYRTDSDGNYNMIPVGVNTVNWGEIKLMFNDKTKPETIEKIQKKAVKKSNSDFYKVLISHSDCFPGVRYVNSSENNFDIIPRSFDMELFDMWCRDGGRTQRWEEQPKWYINTSPAYGSGNEVSKDKIDLVKEIINKDLVEFTNGFINNPEIKEGINPPAYDADGWVIVFWRDDMGQGYHGELLDGNRIYNGNVMFWTIDKERKAYLEELTQVLGPRTERETRYFWDENGQYLPVGLDIGNILHKRKIGSKSPDIDSIPSF